MKWALAIVAIVFAGCMAKVTVDKRPSLALPVYYETATNTVKDYVIVDQGYKVRYFKCGFSTDIQSMSAEINTNKTVSFNLGGLHSYSTNCISIKLDDLLKAVQMFREATNNTSIVIHK